MPHLPRVTERSLILQKSFYKSWIARAETDPLAKQLIHRFQHRPAEELYDVVNDPLEMNNIANDSRLASVKLDLKARLLKWMEQQGDKGQQTEMEALEHQVKGQKE
jgi:uncharacterized sulfatase